MTARKMRQITSPEIVARYLGYFTARGHTELPGSALTLDGITTNFVIAGMQPLLPYLLGQRTPPAPRLVGTQRCLRTDDVDMVGTNGRKLTSFTMLGNWSIGDYGRAGAVDLALGFLDELGLKRPRLWVTTFAGDTARGLAPDEEIVGIWRQAGIPAAHIVPLGMDDNFWSTGGPGPCGPDSEIFVDRGVARGCGRVDCQPGCSCERFLEIWNLVFLEFEWLESGAYRPLPLRSVDTGMGLERIASVLQGVPTVFDTDIFVPALARLDELTPVGEHERRGATPEQRERARHMIVDHARAALLTSLEGVEPWREGRGSVVRRLLRRAARQGRVLGIEGPFLGELVEPLLKGHDGLISDEEWERAARVAALFTEEERRFARTLSAGLRYLDHLEPNGEGRIPGERIFTLHAERGFPADLATEILAERGLSVDWDGYERALDAHRNVSRPGQKRTA